MSLKTVQLLSVVRAVYDLVITLDPLPLVLGAEDVAAAVTSPWLLDNGDEALHILSNLFSFLRLCYPWEQYILSCCNPSDCLARTIVSRYLFSDLEPKATMSTGRYFVEVELLQPGY